MQQCTISASGGAALQTMQMPSPSQGRSIVIGVVEVELGEVRVWGGRGEGYKWTEMGKGDERGERKRERGGGEKARGFEKTGGI